MAGTIPPATAAAETVGSACGAASVALVPIDALLPADSPRRDGVDEAHIAILVESEDPLPPLLVHRQSGRVIDGMHRLHAARRRGRTHVAVQFFDGDQSAAFVAAVTANVAHGLPLSLADREAAAGRIMRCYPHWSNGAVAKATGISAKTVGTLRRRSTREVPELNRRIGQDGRLRPVNGSAGRRLASDLIAAHPEASLRMIARAAGISPATVRDVRDRLHRGDDPVTATQRLGGQPRRIARPVRPAERVEDDTVDPAILDNLRRDPSLRYTEAGRALLRWLDRYVAGRPECAAAAAAVPPHTIPIIVRLARRCAQEWQGAAEQLEQRVREIA